MHTIKQIMDNQAQFKQEIVDFLKNDIQYSLDVLRNMNTNDDEINKELVGLKDKIKNMKNPSIPSLFFASKNRSDKYYAWWDEENQEAIIDKYVKAE